MKKRVLAVLTTLCLLAGCGGKVDTERLEALKDRITGIDTEIASIYGKVEDLHQLARIDDENYAVFTDIDNRADALMEKSETTKDLDGLENEINQLESDFTSYKAIIDDFDDINYDNLAFEITELSFAVDEQEGLMKRALESGKITQERYDEFEELKTKIKLYSMDGDLTYDKKLEKSITEIRQKLAALASEAGADNSLIDRLIGSGSSGSNTAGASGENGTEPTSEAQTAQNGGDETAAAEPTTHELPESAEELNMNYISFQDFALEKHNAGEISDNDMAALIKIGVELTYLKEAIEKDGVTENNTYTSQDIKARLYEKAVEFGYENAEVFK